MNINATLFIQMIVFAILVWFTMKFVWPPITKALDERAQKIADGLAAADKAKAELSSANARVEAELAQSRNETASRLADARQRNICCTGDGWHLRMDLSTGEVFHTLSHTGAPETQRLVSEETNALVLEYSAWHSALVNHTPPASSLSHASQVLRLAETINRLACS